MALWLVWLQFSQWPAPTLGSFVGQDMAVYAYGGWLLKEGYLPNLDFWEHKPPLIYGINAIGLMLSGDAVWGPWLMSLLALLAALGLGYWALRGAFSVQTSLVGMALWSSMLLPSLDSGNLTEVYALPMQWSLVGIGLRGGRWRFPFLAGVAAGMLAVGCFLLRPNLIGTAAALFLVLIVGVFIHERTPWTRACLGTAVGMFVPLALVVVLTPAGWVEAFYEEVFLYNMSYSDARSWGRRSHVFWTGIRFQPVGLLSWVGWGWCLWALVRGRERVQLRDRISRDVLGMVGLVVPFDTVLAAMSGRVYNHYYIAITVAFTLGALFAIDAFRRVRTRPMGWKSIGALSVCTLLTVAFHADRLNPKVDSAIAEETRQIGDWLKANTAPDQRIFFWGGHVGPLLLAERLPACRLYYMTPALERHEGARRLAEEVLLPCVQDFSPGIVVIDASARHGTIPPLLQGAQAADDPWDRFPEVYRRIREGLIRNRREVARIGEVSILMSEGARPPEFTASPE